MLLDKVGIRVFAMTGTGYYPGKTNHNLYIYDEFTAFRAKRKEMENRTMLSNQDILVKGIDDGVKETKEQDYFEAVINAILQAIEKAGVDIESITKLEGNEKKYELLESKVQEFMQPGFKIMDIGYQVDGKYLVILSGKLR